MLQNQKQSNSSIEDDEIQYLILLSGSNSQKHKYYRLQKSQNIQLFGHTTKSKIYFKCLALAVILLLAIVAFLLYEMTKVSIDLPREFNNQRDIISAVANSNNLTTIQKQKTQHEAFIINPCVWIFQKHNPSFLDQLMFSNNKRFASLSNFKVQTLNSTNYRIYISEEGNKKLENVLKILKQRIHNDSSLERNFDAIQKRLILLSILHQKGGVIIDGSLTLTENFDWIRHIQSNIYVNRGDPDTKPQVVGFYSPFYSSEIKKEQKRLKAGMEEVDRYMVLFPAIESYFIAAKERAEFIGRVLEEMISILLFPKSVIKDIKQGKYEYFKRQTTDIYYQSLFLAGNQVMQTRQLELDSENSSQKTRNFAIDSYGLFLINCYYGPQKLHVTLSNVKVSKRIQNIANYDLEEFESSVGPMRYLQVTAIFNSLNDFLTRIRDNKMEKQIMKGSYLQKMYFPEATETFIYTNQQKGLEDVNAPRWDSLPKIVWIFWDSGLETASVETYLCIQTLRRMSASSGFEVKEVNNSNLNDYIDADTLSRIQFTIKNGKMHIFTQTKSDMIRLALLYKYGGIYLDTSVIAVQNFDWLVNIAKFPSQYIFNRYGKVPAVFMFWNPNFGGLLEWEIDSIANTKAGCHSSYQNSIIAAVKGSELIKDWFDLFLQLLMQPISEVLKVLEQCNISNYQWVHQNDQYLLAMDAIKCTIGQRQIWIINQNKSEWKNSMDYYKMWSMSSFFGPFKIRSYMNYANIDRYGNNPFFTRYSEEYVEGITGKFNFMLKFVSSQKQKLLKFIKENYNKLQEETHSQSLFMNYFYNHTQGRFEKTDDIIELINVKKK